MPKTLFWLVLVTSWHGQDSDGTWRTRCDGDPLPAQPLPEHPALDQSELSIQVTWSRSANQRPVLAGTSPGAGIWDRYTIIHWKRPEQFPARLLGHFEALPAKMYNLTLMEQTGGVCILISYRFWQSKQVPYRLQCQRDLIFFVVYYFLDK